MRICVYTFQEGPRMSGGDPHPNFWAQCSRGPFLFTLCPVLLSLHGFHAHFTSFSRTFHVLFNASRSSTNIKRYGRLARIRISNGHPWTLLVGVWRARRAFHAPRTQNQRLCVVWPVLGFFGILRTSPQISTTLMH